MHKVGDDSAIILPSLKASSLHLRVLYASCSGQQFLLCLTPPNVPKVPLSRCSPKHNVHTVSSLIRARCWHLRTKHTCIYCDYMHTHFLTRLYSFGYVLYWKEDQSVVYVHVSVVKHFVVKKYDSVHL